MCSCLSVHISSWCPLLSYCSFQMSTSKTSWDWLWPLTFTFLQNISAIPLTLYCHTKNVFPSGLQIGFWNKFVCRTCNQMAVVILILQLIILKELSLYIFCKYQIRFFISLSFTIRLCVAQNNLDRWVVL